MREPVVARRWNPRDFAVMSVVVAVIGLYFTDGESPFWKLIVLVVAGALVLAAAIGAGIKAGRGD